MQNKIFYSYVTSFSYLIISIFFGFIIFEYVPVDESIKDRINYSNAFLYAQEKLVLLISKSNLSILFNEPLWFLFVGITSIFSVPEINVKILSSLSLTITFYVILKNNPKNIFFVMLILLLPLVIGKYVVHLRQGLAISVFFLGFYSSNIKLKYFLILLTPLIHVSFFFVLYIYIFFLLVRRYSLSLDLSLTLFFLSCLTIFFSFDFLSVFTGSRQAGYYSSSSGNISGLNFIFWFGIIFLYFLQGKTFVHQNLFAIFSIMFYLNLYFFWILSARIFENLILLSLLPGLFLTGYRKVFFMVLVIMYFILNWLVRFNLPFFGWGTGL